MDQNINKVDENAVVKRTLEQVALALRAEFGAEIFVAVIEPKPDPKDGSNTILNYKWHRTCGAEWTHNALKNVVKELS